MTSQTPTRRRRAPVALVATALLAAAAGATGTAALWSSGEPTPLARLTAGDLDIELLRTAEWLETSADVASAPRLIDPTEFLARPGDAVTVSQDFTTELQGDNLVGLLSASWATDPALPSGTTATYTVRDAEGAAVATDVPVGTQTVIERLDADDDGRSDVFTLEVTIEWSQEMADRVGVDAAPQVVDLGDIVLGLEQTRTGEGFTS